MSATRISTTISSTTALLVRTFAVPLVFNTQTEQSLKSSHRSSKSRRRSKHVESTPNMNRTITQVRTQAATQTILIRSTPVTTTTVTLSGSQIGKRDAQIRPMPCEVSNAEKSEYINAFRRQADNSTDLPPDDNVIAASLSSACGCQGYVGSTVTQTYTNQPDVSTLSSMSIFISGSN